MTDLLSYRAHEPEPKPGAWKPTACADCAAPHPSFSATGHHGPWRCQPCHKKAIGA